MGKTILLLAMVTLVAVISSCQQQVVTDPGSGYIDLTINWPSGNETIKCPASTNIQLYPGKTTFTLNQVAPSEIATIEVVIGGPGMSAVSGTFDATTGEGTLPGIAAGSNRVARVIARDSQGKTRYAGDSQFFQVNADSVVAVEVTVALVNHAPSAPVNPNPADGATNIPVQPTFSWDPSRDTEGDPITYDFYLGTANNPPLVASDLTSNSYTPYPPGDPDSLTSDTKYYWRVVAKDPYIGTTSQTWSFNTATNQGYSGPPIADAYVDSANPTANYGSETLLWSSDITSPNAYLRYTFLKFDFSSIQSSAYVTSATLRLCKVGSDPGAGTIYVACNPATSSWTENQITWNNRPNYDTTQYFVLQINLGDGMGTAYDFDVTNVVRMMVSEGFANNGFVVRILASNNAEISWDSRESSSTQYRPEIIVHYTP